MRETTLCYLQKDSCYLMLHRVKKQNDANHDKWIGVGGGLFPGETPLECAIREVWEETGYTMQDATYRGVVNFHCDMAEDEIMHLFTSENFTGEPIECNEGDLQWVPIDLVPSLPGWVGDRIFLKLLKEGAPFFAWSLYYEGDNLISAILDGQPIPLPE